MHGLMQELRVSIQTPVVTVWHGPMMFAYALAIQTGRLSRDAQGMAAGFEVRRRVDTTSEIDGSIVRR